MFGRRVGNTNRKQRSDKRIRVNLSLSQETYAKLKMLAFACAENSSISTTGLASEMVELCLRQPEIINWFQKKYRADKYRVIPVTSDNGVDLIAPRY